MALLTHEQAARLGANTVRPAVFLIIKCSPATWVRAWTGAFPFDLEADTIDPTGGRYVGKGDLSGIPTISQLINGVAERVEFTLSGISREGLRLANADANALRSAQVHLGLTGLDAEWQPLSAPLWLWEGQVDTPKIRADPQADEQGVVQEVRAISISVGSLFTGRKRPRYAHFTGPDQRGRSPTDAFCDRTVLHENAEKNWP